MKHHKLDIILVLIALIQILVLVSPFLVSMSPLTIGLLVFLNILLIGTNYQCVAHNFIHNPFFKNKTLNQVFSIINSLGLIIPESMYRIHHINHHRHNNDPATDESSTWRYGKDGKEENILSYSVKGFLRTDLAKLYSAAKKNSSLVDAEAAFLLISLLILLLLNWKLFLFYLVPSAVGGQIFAMWENYCEHHYANPKDRMRDSVSCYNPLYNLLWFNNGHHQEHHYSPQVHWTNIPEVKNKLPSDRVIVKGWHINNSL